MIKLSQRMRWWVMFAVGMMTVLAWCGQPSTSPTDTNLTDDETMMQPTTIKVGLIAPISWPASLLWEEVVGASQYIVDQFNTSQDMYTIDLIIEDGKCSGKDATSAVQKLINIDQVKLILGGQCSGETIAAAKVAQPAWVVMLSAVSSNPVISEIGDNIFRMYNDNNQAQAMADYFSQKNANIAVVYENNDFGVWLRNTFKELFDNDMIIIEEKYNSDEKDFAIIAKNILEQADNIDGIVAIVQVDTSAQNIMMSLIDEWLSDELKNQTVFSEGWYSEVIAESLGDDINGFRVAQFPTLGTQSQAKALLDAYTQTNEIKYAENFVLLAAETTQLMLDAIVDAWSDDTGSIKAFFNQYTQSNQRAWYFGDYYFVPSGDAIGLDFVVREIVDGKLE